MIPRALESEIVRLYHAEHWPVGTIARQLRVHHATVRRALRAAGVERERGLVDLFRVKRACRGLGEVESESSPVLVGERCAYGMEYARLFDKEQIGVAEERKVAGLVECSSDAKSGPSIHSRTISSTCGRVDSQNAR